MHRSPLGRETRCAVGHFSLAGYFDLRSGFPLGHTALNESYALWSNFIGGTTRGAGGEKEVTGEGPPEPACFHMQLKNYYTHTYTRAHTGPQFRCKAADGTNHLKVRINRQVQLNMFQRELLVLHLQNCLPSMPSRLFFFF